MGEDEPRLILSTGCCRARLAAYGLAGKTRCCHSAYFTQLNRIIQDEVIARTEHRLWPQSPGRKEHDAETGIQLDERRSG